MQHDLIDLTDASGDSVIDLTADDSNDDEELAITIADLIHRDDAAGLRQIVRAHPLLNLSLYPSDWGSGLHITPIFHSIVWKKWEAFRFLLSMNVDLEIKASVQMRTVLSYAMTMAVDHPEYAETLLAHGARVHTDVILPHQPLAVLADKINRRYPSAQPPNRCMQMASNMIESLARDGKLNALSRNGQGYLHFHNFTLEWIEMLLEAGADPNLASQQNGYSFTALHVHASALSSPEIVGSLLHHGADVNAIAGDARVQREPLRIALVQSVVFDGRNDDMCGTIRLLFDYNANTDFLMDYEIDELPPTVSALVVLQMLERGYDPAFLEHVDLHRLPHDRNSDRLFELLENMRQSRAFAVALSYIPNSRSRLSVLPSDIISRIVHEATPEYFRAR